MSPLSVVMAPQPASSLPSAGQEVAQNPPTPMGLIMLFAFLGGLILNLMPCVLPVLSLKVMNLVSHAHSDQARVWLHGVFYTLGVLVAFWVLAAILLILRALGQQIGWGFQFQSPTFLVVLSFVFFLFALNLFGMFEIQISLSSASGRPGKGSGLFNSFGNGLLATVAATPCTAPFMGTAIGVALLQPAVYSIAIFTLLGLGMAIPLFLLTLFPRWLCLLPKPGPWMNYLKRFFGVLLLGVVTWLGWILSLQKGFVAVLTLGLGLVIIWFAVRCTRLHRESTLGKTTGRFLITGLAASGLALALVGAHIIEPPVHQPEKRAEPFEWRIPWRDYSKELVDSLKEEGRPFFIDFTAAWCLSCQVNDRVVFHAPEVINKFKETNIVPIKADWTLRDEAITQALAGYGKNSIPLYVLYTGDKARDPVILPEIITPGIVLKALENVE